MIGQTVDRRWPLVALETVATINPSKPKYEGLTDEDPVGFIPMAAVDERSGRVTDVESRSLGGLRPKSYRTFASGDVLFAKITPCMENGKVALAPELPSGQGFGSTEFHVVRCGPRLDPEFLWRFLRQSTYRREAERHMTGSVGQLRVPADFLRQSQLPLPPVEEQRKLVQLLRAMDGHGETAHASMTIAEKSVTEAQRAILRAAATGALTADWRESHGASSAWAYERAADVCEKVQSGTTPKQWHDASGGVPFLKVYNIVDQQLDFAYRPQYISPELHNGVMARAGAKPGDVLMNIVGPPLGKVAILTDEYPEWSINQALALFRPSGRVTSEWLFLFLSSGISVDQVMHETRGSAGQVNISLTQCRNLQIPVPSVEEQAVACARARKLLAAAAEVATNIVNARSATATASEASFAKALRVN